jgi:hypothetical protein
MMSKVTWGVCQNVVCDVHLADMKSVQRIHVTGALHKLREGFAACPVNGGDSDDVDQSFRSDAD